MGKIEKIEHLIEALTAQELAEFRRWYREFDAEAWDRQIQDDIQANKLDVVAEEAIKEYRAGKARESC